MENTTVRVQSRYMPLKEILKFKNTWQFALLELQRLHKQGVEAGLLRERITLVAGQDKVE